MHGSADFSENPREKKKEKTKLAPEIKSAISRAALFFLLEKEGSGGQTITEIEISCANNELSRKGESTR